MEYNLNNVIAERANKTIYQDNGKTIKLFIENYSKADILNEALNLARVEEATDLNVPKLIEIGKIENRWALITEYVEGKPLSQLMEEHPEKLEEYLQFFVKIQLEVLSKKVPLLSRIKDKFRRKLTEATNISNEVRYDLLQRLEGMKNHAKLCHGDFNPSNIIVKENGEYCILDWSHATQGNASADAATTYIQFLLTGDKASAEYYLKAFCKKTDTALQYVQKWMPIVAAALSVKASPEDRAALLKMVNVVEYE